MSGYSDDEDDFESSEDEKRPEEDPAVPAAVSHGVSTEDLLRRKRAKQERAKRRMRALHRRIDEKIMKQVRRRDRLARKMTAGSPYVPNKKSERRPRRQKVRESERKRTVVDEAVRAAASAAHRLNKSRESMKRLSVNDFSRLASDPHQKTYYSRTSYLHVLRASVFVLRDGAPSKDSMSWAACCRQLGRPDVVERLIKVKPSSMNHSLLESLACFPDTEPPPGTKKISFRAVASSSRAPAPVRVLANWLGALQEGIIMTFALRELHHGEDGDQTKMKSPTNVWQWMRVRRSRRGKKTSVDRRDVRKGKARIRRRMLAPTSKLLEHIDSCNENERLSLENFGRVVRQVACIPIEQGVLEVWFKELMETSGDEGVTWKHVQEDLFGS